MSLLVALTIRKDSTFRRTAAATQQSETAVWTAFAALRNKPMIRPKRHILTSSGLCDKAARSQAKKCRQQGKRAMSAGQDQTATSHSRYEPLIRAVRPL